MERADREIDLLTLPVTRKNLEQAMFDVIERQFESPNLEKFVKFDETIAIIIENVEDKARKVVEEKISV